MIRALFYAFNSDGCEIMKKFLWYALLFISFGAAACAASSRNNGTAPGSAASDGRPEITEEKIRDNINGRTVEGVPEETNASPPINWTFLPDEPKEFTVLEKQMKDDDRATVIIDMKTRSAEGSRNLRHLSGKLRLHYELQNEFVWRKWRIVEVENISMKYNDEPKKEQPKEQKEQKQGSQEDSAEEQDGEQG
jgi:hypothetical protein